MLGEPEWERNKVVCHQILPWNETTKHSARLQLALYCSVSVGMRGF